MAKVKLGNVKGPKGEQGVRGSKWYNTDKITGESTSGTAFPNSGIADAMVGDMALNPTTLNLYTCQTAGNAATAKWVFMACIKGPQGAKGDKGDPTTVDAVLSKDSTNPIQNKAVATKFQDVQDSLDRAVAFNAKTFGIDSSGKMRLTFSETSNHVGGFIYCTGNGTPWYGMVGKTSNIVGNATVTYESGSTFLVSAGAWNYGVIIPIDGTVDVKPA